MSAQGPNVWDFSTGRCAFRHSATRAFKCTIASLMWERAPIKVPFPALSTAEPMELVWLKLVAGTPFTSLRMNRKWVPHSG